MRGYSQPPDGWLDMANAPDAPKPYFANNDDWLRWRCSDISGYCLYSVNDDRNATSVEFELLDPEYYCLVCTVFATRPFATKLIPTGDHLAKESGRTQESSFDMKYESTAGGNSIKFGLDAANSKSTIGVEGATAELNISTLATEYGVARI